MYFKKRPVDGLSKAYIKNSLGLQVASPINRSSIALNAMA
jgi:hypothetical protein